MGFAGVLILLIITVHSDAKSIEKEFAVCAEIDRCSCNLTGVEQPGVIDLHSLVNGKREPTFVTQVGHHNYFYNPCLTFSSHVCANSALCQTADRNEIYNLGDLDSVKFLYNNNSLFAFYHGDDRSSSVQLICDESEMEGRFEFVGMPVAKTYHFKLYTQSACPRKSKVECKAKDLCSCEMSDGTGTIDLNFLNNPANPVRDVVSPTHSFLYNPCAYMLKPDCKYSSLCEEQGDLLLPIGLTVSARFVLTNSSQLSLLYDNVELNYSVSIVNLICDPNQRNEPFFKAVGDGHTFNLYSVCACPNGCYGVPSNGSCDQTDSCTCKSTSDGAVINLHDLDNPYAALTAIDNEGYTYYYNPCSGIKLQNPTGKCNGVAACQKDPFHNNTWYNIGDNVPKIGYNVVSKSFTFYYTGGEGGRFFEVRMICDRDSKAPVLAADGVIPIGVLRYRLKLISKYACSV